MVGCEIDLPTRSGKFGTEIAKNYVAQISAEIRSVVADIIQIAVVAADRNVERRARTETEKRRKRSPPSQFGVSKVPENAMR
jgi:hypothetical protein